jgi:hypothetical protein
MPARRRALETPRGEQRRHTETIMRAHGFTMHRWRRGRDRGADHRGGAEGAERRRMMSIPIWLVAVVAGILIGIVVNMVLALAACISR